MNPYVIEIMIKEKQRETLAEAQRLRLIAEYEAHRQTTRAKVLAALGEKLIALGEELKNRYSCKPQLPVCKAS